MLEPNTLCGTKWGAVTFGETMRELMAERGLSLGQLAKMAPYDKGQLSKVSRDIEPPSAALAKRLDAALGAHGALIAAVPPRRSKWRSPAVSSEFTADDEDRLTLAIDRPSRVDMKVVKDLGMILGAQRRLDDTLGPALILRTTLTQADTVMGLLKHTRGDARTALGPVAAEYLQFAGWLRAELRQDQQAVRTLTAAEELADEIEDGTLAAQATNFKGWLARQQNRPRAVVRHFLTAFHTPGVHPAQQLGDAVQAAHGYAMLGQRRDALSLLDHAEGLADRAERELPPGTAYWLTPKFHRLSIGLALIPLERHRDAAEYLASGLDSLPADQQEAEWTTEYRQALRAATESA